MKLLTYWATVWRQEKQWDRVVSQLQRISLEFSDMLGDGPVAEQLSSMDKALDYIHYTMDDGQMDGRMDKWTDGWADR